ncbi:MAG TPA: LysR substrate-binding domain-containing protein [Burkholderiales bacterium]|jgi:DNA-binding transcriptional LysR family regulator
MHEIDLRHVDLNLLVVFEVLMAERSVTRAAERLGRTQSAVSHALSRLRGQLGDPLLVKSGGGMQPSPFSTELIEQVRPILRSVQRVLSPRRSFAPATSRRTFRLAVPDLALTLFPRLLELVRKEAPGVVLEWVSPRQNMLLDVVEGQLDLAFGPAGLRLPEGIATESIGALRWCCFGRKGHPAFAKWGLKAWSRWPHVAVGVGDRVSNPVSDAAAAASAKRTVAARVPNFAAVAPLLAKSDLLATLPAIVMVDATQRFDVVAMPLPLAVEPMPHVLLWSARLSNDPEIAWLRALLRTVIAEILSASERLLPKTALRPTD